jgi:hypothetical protein
VLGLRGECRQVAAGIAELRAENVALRALRFEPRGVTLGNRSTGWGGGLAAMGIGMNELPIGRVGVVIAVTPERELNPRA